MTSTQKKKLEKIRHDLNFLISEAQDDLDTSSDSFKDSEEGELAAEHIEFMESAMSELDNIE